MKGKDSTCHFCFLGELKKKISREKNKNMRHNRVKVSENGGQYTNNIVGYFDTKSLSASLSYCITDIFRCFIQVYMKKKKAKLWLNIKPKKQFSFGLRFGEAVGNVREKKYKDLSVQCPNKDTALSAPVSIEQNNYTLPTLAKTNNVKIQNSWDPHVLQLHY